MRISVIIYDVQQHYYDEQRGQLKTAENNGGACALS